MRADRLLAIILRLLYSGRLTAKELADELGVSERTIYREIRALDCTDLPLVAEPGRKGGYYLLESFPLSRHSLSLSVLLDFYSELAVKTGRCYEKDRLRAVEIIADMMPGAAGSRNLLSDADFLEPAGVAGRRVEKLKKLYSACREEESLKLGYYDADRGYSFHSVTPGSIIYRGFEWYLSGHSSQEGSFQLFALGSIEEIEAVDTGSMPGPDYEIDDQGRTADSRSGDEYLSCRLLIEKGEEKRAFELLPAGAYAGEREDGLIFELNWPCSRWVKRTILSFGNSALVISPDWLAAEIREEAEGLLARYEEFEGEM